MGNLLHTKLLFIIGLLGLLASMASLITGHQGGGITLITYSFFLFFTGLGGYIFELVRDEN